MEAEDLSGRELTIDSIMNKVRDIKNKFKNEDLTDELSLNKVSADTTDNSGTVNQIMMANNPEDWLNLLLKLEKNSVPLNDALLNKLIGRYSQAIEVLPPDKYGQNESFAQIQVRFAELKAIQEPDDARDYFQMARANCKKFAFVHVSFAQFELSQGNFKKSKQLLHKAVECGAVPLEMLEIAIRNLNLQKKQLLSEEEKKSLLVLTAQESFPSSLGHLQNRNISCDSRGQTTKARFLYGENMPPQDAEIGHRNPLKQTNKAKRSCPFGRVPVNLLSSPDYGKTDGSVVPSFTKRQTSGSERRDMIVPASKSTGNESSELRHLKSIQNIHSKEPLMSDEKSSELITDSLTLKNKTEPGLLTKLEETKEHQEPKVPESDQKQWQSMRKPECVNQNPAASSNQWQIPEIARKVDTEQKQTTFEQPVFSVSKQSPPISAPKRTDPKSICKTPSSSALDDYMSCFRTPVVKNDFPPACQLSTPYSQLAYFQQQRQQIPVTPLQTLQISASSSTNECISVKGRMYSILKQIGSGGSSKVFQVLNEKKQIHAIKYVNLEEADNQTIESYRNEIAYLNKLQQHSDKIIRLYDYEITDQYIYMVMECGNIDLNSWLKKKKSINPWERKSYWKNMLEAVYTIHQHGIVHSDLKPANFLIVDGMLKLIDFGIANQMQPDTTSIVKDSQVGTVNYMPPEAIKDMSSSRENGKSKSKISPKSDVWSLGCILYYMTYGKTPFQHIINQISKLHAIIDPNHEIEFPDIPEKDLQDVLKCCLIRDPKQRISIPELLAHPYVQIQTHPGNQMAKGTTEEMKYVLGQLVGLNSPNSILKAAKTLYDHYSSGESHDSSSSKTFEKKWEKK
ncbi:dual specificity protein kinase TTK isoform X1 [Callorhinus ursinus]|uniref:Dual specificity protein kinase TTK n=1 Tax=Callorhinus ursinus TaxID=34884 RepID=A0A3Q7N1A5_CALUR|nr:dual specificity protein kinase TTK isoform X1 [Callorhinus ursinus]XP_025714353.1 dual specificity protein kinase TTK isoform X1 [Callorhinus ursinus]XP_025714358.1 dual specificity protein kinase TTK isoform X1 [Callorhinus ursinus]XP_025714751.1 dual specificity protein kinase TTK isoform X1 [Callorhinus ursinus]XP_025714758.1 dual specificity protein kinase TTK isoform X1 [Callorhinus ursinus]XP_025714767.1 dual specificity protein kinase TTK isoform X1 [Callorhinus ursinus]